MGTRTIEIWVGVFIAAGLAALFMLAMKVSNLSTYQGEAGYEVVARFGDVSGLKARSPVTVAGVRIGRIKQIAFDDQTLEAVVVMEIEPQHDKLPRDTSASIYTSGLLGEKYIGLDPGGDEENLKQGDEIQLTQDSLVLEKLVGQFVANFINNKSDKKAENK
jgi:phospholipid/cholesterol/gamma-HCH transport system substrate-binding protein